MCVPIRFIFNFWMQIFERRGLRKNTAENYKLKPLSPNRKWKNMLIYTLLVGEMGGLLCLFIVCVCVCARVRLWNFAYVSTPIFIIFVLIPLASNSAFKETDSPCRRFCGYMFRSLLPGHYHFCASQPPSACVYLLKPGFHISLGKAKCYLNACLL